MADHILVKDQAAYGCILPYDADYRIEGNRIDFHAEDDISDSLESNPTMQAPYNRHLAWNEIQMITEEEAEERGLIETEPTFVEYLQENYGPTAVHEGTKFPFADAEVVNGKYVDMKSHITVPSDPNVEIVYAGADDHIDGKLYLGLQDTR